MVSIAIFVGVIILLCIICKVRGNQEGYHSVDIKNNKNELFSVSYYIKNESILVVQGNGILQETMLYPLISDEKKDKIKTIVIENGITEIGDDCFSGVFGVDNNVRKIVIADSVTRIGKGNFYDFQVLESVDMGDGIKVIDDRAFDTCINLSQVVLPKKLEKIKKYAFSNCVSLTSIDFPTGLHSIGKLAFSRCRGLTKVTLPDSVTTVSDGAFSECENVEEITLSRDLTKWDTLGEQCPALQKVTNNSQREWFVSIEKGNREWFVNEKKVKRIPAGKIGVAHRKQFMISTKVDGGQLEGAMPSEYEYGKLYPIQATVKKKGYYCIGWYAGEEAEDGVWFFNPTASIGRRTSGDLVMHPLMIKYNVENVDDHILKVTLSDKGLPYIQEYYEIRYSENEDMSNAKTKILEGKGNVKLRDLVVGKRYYFEFRWGSLEGNEDGREPESPWMGKRSVVVI